MELYITWTGTTQCPTVQTHMLHQMQEDPAFNEPVAYARNNVLYQNQ